MKKTAPLGDPIIISLRGTDLAIRKKDAELIYIKEACSMKTIALIR